MNYKKGLLRLFIVSSIGMFFWGYFVGSDGANKTYMNQYGYMGNAIDDLKKPICLEAIKDQPTKFPDWLRQSSNPCFALAMQYEDTKAFHDKEKRAGQLTAKDFQDEFEDTWGNYRLKRGAIEGAIALGGFWIMLTLVGLAFLIVRWIYRGFKGNKHV